MTIEKLSNTAIKISLEKDDLDFYGVDFTSLDNSNYETHIMITEILQQAKTETGLDLCNGKLFIEAFSNSNGGCLLYVSSIEIPATLKPKKRTSIYNYLICDISDIKYLVPLCRQLFSACSHIINKSTLYCHNNTFRLCMQAHSKSDKRVSMILSEYGRVIKNDELLIAFTCEHFDCIVKGNAIEKISEIKVS